MLKQFEKLLENIQINEIEIKQQLKTDIEKFTKLQSFLLGTKEKIDINHIDIRGYAKYVLRHGSNLEKRELIGCFKSKLRIINQTVKI